MEIGELILILAVLLTLSLTRHFFSGSFEEPGQSARGKERSVALWIAQGFGAGRIPWGPGTFGSLVGLLWFALLLRAHNLWVFAAGTIAGIALSVWLCGIAEKLLGRKDPGSAVLDEVAAMPVCFLSWMAILIHNTGSLPTLEAFYGARNWPLSLGVFAAFRFFDIVKPWPVRQSQSLPGGWGVTVDDLLAALYVNITVWLVYAGKLLLAR